VEKVGRKFTVLFVTSFTIVVVITINPKGLFEGFIISCIVFVAKGILVSVFILRTSLNQRLSNITIAVSIISGRVFRKRQIDEGFLASLFRL